MELGPETTERLAKMNSEKEALTDLVEQIGEVAGEFPEDYHVSWEEGTTKFRASRYSFGWVVEATFHDLVETTTPGFWPWSEPVVIYRHNRFNRMSLVHIYNDEMTRAHNGQRLSLRGSEPEDAAYIITAFYNKLSS